MKNLTPLLLALSLSGCTQIVTAPIAVASKVVTTTFDIAGAAGGAVVNTVSGGSKE